MTDLISVELGETDSPLTTSLRPFTNGTKAAKYLASVDALNLKRKNNHVAEVFKG